MQTMGEEIERLSKVKGIGESIARLPSACLENLNSAEEVRAAKESALASSIDQIRGKDYDKLVKDIEDLQNKSKRAYVRLYEKVGEDVGSHFLNQLDYMGDKQTEADKLLAEGRPYSSAQHELTRLQEEKSKIAKMQHQKDKESLRGEEGGIKTNIHDLFRKYNIWAWK